MTAPSSWARSSSIRTGRWCAWRTPPFVAPSLDRRGRRSSPACGAQVSLRAASRTFLATGRGKDVGDASTLSLDGVDHVRARERAGAHLQRRTRAQAALQPGARARRRPDRLREDLQARRQARSERRDRQGFRAQEGRVRPPHRRGLRGGAGRRSAHDRPRGLRAVRRHRPDVLRAHLSRRARRRRREDVRVAGTCNGEVGARGDRQVRDAQPAVPGLPARAREDAHPRADAFRRRGRAARRCDPRPFAERVRSASSTWRST